MKDNGKEDKRSNLCVHCNRPLQKSNHYTGKRQITCHRKCRREYRKNIKNRLVPCACNCGGMVWEYDKAGRGPRKFIERHMFNLPINTGRKHTEQWKQRMRGRRPANYKGGTKRKDGYIQKNMSEIRMLEHRYVWEQHHKACLLRWSNIHHKNGNRADNRIENLEGMMASRHTILHQTEDMSDRRCLVCGGITKGHHKGSPAWYRHPITKEEWVCSACWERLKYKMKKCRVKK